MSRVRPAGHQLWDSRLRHCLSVLMLALVFSISYTQLPLYAENQNEYFLRGLARTGFGLLQHDWLAHTADVTPAFSLMVEWTYHYLHRRGFYLEFILVLGVYIYSLLGIASSLYGINRSRTQYLTYLALVVLLFSPLLDYLPPRIFGFTLAAVVYDGVGYEGILRHYLQPSSFGALLLLSIYLFLGGKPLLAVVSSSLAAVFHPVYLLPAGVLTISYLLTLARRGESLRNVLGVGACALGVALPIIVYTYVVFRPTSPDTWKAASAIFVHFAVAAHAVPRFWLGPVVLIKAAIVLIALYAIRRTELFLPMLLLLVTAVGLTTIQMLSGSDALAVFLPWRLSVVLVPLASSVILALVVSRLVSGLEKWRPGREHVLVELSMLTLGVLIGAGVVMTIQSFRSPIEDGSGEVMRFVSAHKSSEDTYLVPFDARDWFLFEKFRLDTGAPTFVDHRLVPKKDTDVIEWYKRVRLAEAFYEAGGEARCQLSRTLFADYKITHVILKIDDAGGCSDWKLLFKDQRYALVAVPPSATSRKR